MGLLSFCYARIADNSLTQQAATACFVAKQDETEL